MSSSLLRLTCAAMFALILPNLLTGQTNDEPPKRQEAIPDPFAEIKGNPIPLTQEDDTQPNKDADKNLSNGKTQDPFRMIGRPVERTANRQIADPFASPGEQQIEDLEVIDAQAINPLDQQPVQNDPVVNSTEQELPAEKSFEDKFWEYLTSNAYQNWAPAPGQDGGFYEGRSPHGDFLKMYLNRTAAAAPNELPNGSIIVKENYAADQKTMTAITVMYRSKGYNPDSGDWYWIKYNPDGSVARTPQAAGGQKIMGKAGRCIECHGGAADNDFTFFNDK